MIGFSFLVLTVNIIVVTSEESAKKIDGERKYDHEADSKGINYKKWLQEAIYNAAEKDLKSSTEDFNHLPRNGELFEGDILMDDFIRSAVIGRKSKKAAARRSRLWPDKTLVYDVDDSLLPRGRMLLAKAIREFQKRTCIKFKRRTDERDYVVYSSDQNQCSSYIGKTGRKQIIHLGKDCMVLGTVEHETMHALGFIHEHSRPDRDDYIKVKYHNIDKKEWINFSKYSLDEVDSEDVDYNFASVMHYRNDAFSKNGRNTIEAIGEPDLRFGQRIKFSVGDIKEINKLYDCHSPDPPNYSGLFRDYGGKNQRKDILLRKRIIRKLKDISRILSEIKEKKEVQ